MRSPPPASLMSLGHFRSPLALPRRSEPNHLSARRNSCFQGSFVCNPPLRAPSTSDGKPIGSLCHSDALPARYTVGTDGMPISSFYNGTQAQTIYLKTVGSDGKPIEQIENVSIFSMMPSLSSFSADMLAGLMDGRYSDEEFMEALIQTTPLSQVVDSVGLEWRDPVIIRDNGQRAMRAQANPIKGVTTEDARQSIVSEIEAIELPIGYTMKWKGEADASA